MGSISELSYDLRMLKAELAATQLREWIDSNCLQLDAPDRECWYPGRDIDESLVHEYCHIEITDTVTAESVAALNSRINELRAEISMAKAQLRALGHIDEDDVELLRG
jgi:hypothetical protein